MFNVVILKAKPKLTQDDFDVLLQIVSPEKKKRIENIYSFKEACNCLLGDVLARNEISRVLDIFNEEIKITTTEYGKPVLQNNPNIHFNVSHAGEYIVCTIADEPVGIDIEIIKPINMQIAKRFFAQDEISYILDGNQIRRFFEVWTKKESRIKCEGYGFKKPLKSFSVFYQEDKYRYYKTYQNKKTICHVCSKKDVTPNVRVINIIEFFKEIKSYEKEKSFCATKDILLCKR